MTTTTATATVRLHGLTQRVRMNGNETFTALEALHLWAEAQGAEILAVQA